LDQHDIPGVRQMAAEHDWLDLGECIGSGSTRSISVELHVKAYAARQGDGEPVIRPGPWQTHVALARGLACQPLVQLAPTDGYLPVSGNISGFPAEHHPAGLPAAPAGLVCYADRWDPTRLTLAWVVFQVARIVGGEVLSLEAQPLSLTGRDFQALAFAQGALPTHVVATPRSDLLFLQPASDPLAHHGIEFLDEPLA
jgi:hypothetical protein